MIIDTDKIRALLEDSTVTYGQIKKATSISTGALSRYRNGQLPIDHMQLRMAKKLQDYYEKIKE